MYWEDVEYKFILPSDAISVTGKNKGAILKNKLLNGDFTMVNHYNSAWNPSTDTVNWIINLTTTP